MSENPQGWTLVEDAAGTQHWAPTSYLEPRAALASPALAALRSFVPAAVLAHLDKLMADLSFYAAPHLHGVRRMLDALSRVPDNHVFVYSEHAVME